MSTPTDVHEPVVLKKGQMGLRTWTGLRARDGGERFGRRRPVIAVRACRAHVECGRGGGSGCGQGGVVQGSVSGCGDVALGQEEAFGDEAEGACGTVAAPSRGACVGRRVVRQYRRMCVDLNAMCVHWCQQRCVTVTESETEMTDRAKQGRECAAGTNLPSTTSRV